MIFFIVCVCEVGVLQPNYQRYKIREFQPIYFMSIQVCLLCILQDGTSCFAQGRKFKREGEGVKRDRGD